MPLVHVDITQEKTSEYRGRLSRCRQQALHASMDVLSDECFQVLATHPPGSGYRAGASERRPYHVDKSSVLRALGHCVARRRRLRREDLVVNLVTVQPEDRPFDNGAAQMA